MARAKPSAKADKNAKVSETIQPKQPALSEEHVGDSGSDSGSESANSGAPNGKNTSSINNSFPRVTNMKAADDSGSSSDSSEDESEDEDTTESSNADEHQATSKATSVTVGTLKRKATSETSSTTSSSLDQGQLQNAKDVKRRKHNSLGDKASSKDGYMPTGNQRRPTSGQTESTEGTVTTRKGTSVTSKQYQPPTGYSPLKFDIAQDRTAISNRDVDRSNIWHIMAPADVPLSLLRNVTLESISKGRSVLTNEGTGYILVEDTGSEAIPFITLPGKSGYELVSQRISRTLNLQQIINLPFLGRRLNGSAVAADVTEAPVSFVRAQPRGLRMRYMPPGSGLSNVPAAGLESDSEDEGSLRTGEPGYLKTNEHSSRASSLSEKKKKRKTVKEPGSKTLKALGMVPTPHSKDATTKQKSENKARRQTERANGQR
ncbi:hypothetical protein K431DRAFT_288726 [Polychaeton citri CBS 116435]|uniref:Uncharacterized protein n=1 Tax=Polychaeton citri CBS 116435 TaxID=1314669 RepID=A0A9P4UIT2_9PEZI|nr:hypothetical protein K431DRAFT_288726 [Polychaeton citri CBS 116435]